MEARLHFRATLIAAAVAVVTGVSAPAGAQHPGDPKQQPDVVRSPGAPIGGSSDTAADARIDALGVADHEIVGATTGIVTSEGMANAYVLNRRGEVVRSQNGDCVETLRYAASDASIQCDPTVLAQLAPAQPPSGQVEAPTMEQPAQTEPAPLAAAPERRRISLSTDTTFDFDSADLTDEGKQQLDDLAQMSKDVEQTRIHVTGHSDRIGSDDYNRDLSQRRAEAVKDYLVDRGVPEEVVTLSAVGEESPVVQCEGMTGNALVECLGPNRRTEIEFAAFEEVPPVDETTAPTE